MARATTYIVLFRGVGGATQLPTKALVAALGEAGFTDPRTYINSGNALVTSELPRRQVAAKIAALTKQKFGFGKEILLATAAEWRRLMRANPYPDAAEKPTWLHAFLLTKKPSAAAVAALAARAAPHEQLTVTGKVLYFHAPQGFGTSKLPPLVDRTLGVVSTARNWNTVTKLAELAAAPPS